MGVKYYLDCIWKIEMSHIFRVGQKPTWTQKCTKIIERAHGEHVEGMWKTVGSREILLEFLGGIWRMLTCGKREEPLGSMWEELLTFHFRG